MKYIVDCYRNRNKLLVRTLENGIDRTEIVHYKPYLFVPVKKQTEYKDFYRKSYLEKISFETIYEMSNHIKTYSDMPDYLWGNANPVLQYIKANTSDIFPKNDIRGCYIDIEIMTSEKINGEYIHHGFPNANEAKYPINAICHYDTYDDKFYVFGTGLWDKSRSCFPELAEKVEYTLCQSEEELLKRYLKFFKEKTPHYITGWNIEGFDIPYIINRIKNIFGDSAVSPLSPFGLVEKKNDGQTYNIAGVPILDYLHLYRKYILSPRESYTLNYIVKIELNDSKKEFEGTHGTFYWEDSQGFYDYNIKDTSLVFELQKKLHLLDIVFEIATIAGINFEDVMSPIRTWNALVYNECLEHGIVPPISEKHISDNGSYEGAYVKEPIPGMVKNIVSVDFTSLYPSIMREWNISPDTYVSDTNLIHELEEAFKSDTELYTEYKATGDFKEYLLAKNTLPEAVNEVLSKNNVSVALNGSLYYKDYTGILDILLTRFFNERKSEKKQAQDLKKRANALGKEHSEYKHLISESNIHNVKQSAFKVLLNSVYGACGSPFFDFYNERIAEAVTLTGQFLVRDSGNFLNKVLNNIVTHDDYVMYQDTDSIYFEVTPIVKLIKDCKSKISLLDDLFKHIEKGILPNYFKRISGVFNTFSEGSILHLKREAISVNNPAEGQEYCGFWHAKKKYCLLVNDNEGFLYDKPQMKIMGLSLIQSSTPSYFRNKLSEFIEIFLKQGEKSRFFINQVSNDYMNAELNELAFPRSVSYIKKYYKNGIIQKGAPAHSRAAINYNELLEANNLTNKYQDIKEGDKIKFVYLKVDNPFGMPVIAYKDKLPSEFGLNEYIDYATQFNKAFLKPIEDMFKTCGWSIEERLDIDDLFG